MKKLSSLVLAVIMILGLCACSKEEKKESVVYKHDVDVLQLAREGAIPEIEFLIGDPIDDVKDILFKMGSSLTFDEYKKAALDAGFNGGDDELFSQVVTKTETAGYTVLSTVFNTNQEVFCLYKTESENQVISALAITGTAYGYKGGNTLKKFVENTIEQKGKAITEDSPVSFLPKISEGASGISYEAGAYQLDFYFSTDDTLKTTIIYNTVK